MYLILASIVDNVITKCFVPDTTLHGFCNSLHKIFEHGDIYKYVLRVLHKMRFAMTTRFVGREQSFRQAQESLRVAPEVGSSPTLNKSQSMSSVGMFRITLHSICSTCGSFIWTLVRRHTVVHLLWP